MKEKDSEKNHVIALQWLQYQIKMDSRVGSKSTLLVPCQYSMPPTTRPGYKQRFGVKLGHTAIVFSPPARWPTAVTTGSQDPANHHCMSLS